MTTQASHRIQKTRIAITVEGCISCGTLWSSGWHIVQTITATIGKKEYELPLHRCADCQKAIMSQKEHDVKKEIIHHFN